MKTLLFSIALCLSLFVCLQKSNAQQKQGSGETTRQVHKPNDTVAYTIFRYDRKKHGSIYRNGQPTVITKSELADIEAITIQLAERYNKVSLRNQININNLKNYYRQYVPYINVKREREVWVNCFCLLDANWRKKIITSKAGGSCYFKLVYNLKTKKVHEFGVNKE